VSATPEVLRALLREAQARGDIGPGALEAHLAHAHAFFGGPTPPAGGRCIDLGSGAGLPGLVLAVAYPESRWVLVDARRARCDALARAISALGLESRVEVCHARAEAAGRGARRGWADTVTARGFGAPPVTAECAAPLLSPGGMLVVSDATGEDRWPASGLAPLHLAPVAAWSTAFGAFRSFRQLAPCPDRFPRQPAAIARRPLFGPRST
jgi:16S rRNA (guanine527-N7)-methyltransferase